jgi:lipid A disaccharide synthetase
LTKILAHIPYASPINWVLNEGNPQKEGVPELLQEDATAENMYRSIYPLIIDSSEREEQLRILEKTTTKLSNTDDDNSSEIASIVLSYTSN